jgi:alpha-tubulin suppressor-like RCC1 family protein
MISTAHYGGVAVDKQGWIYSWGRSFYGGRGWSVGATQVAYLATDGVGLPSPTIEGYMPTQVESGYQTTWIMMENGEVWHLGGSDNFEVPGAQGGPGLIYSGGVTPDSSRKVVPVRTEALSPWFRANNPDEYIIQVHSGIYFGAALLSTGRVLTWGSSGIQAIGRACGGTSTSDCSSEQARNPGYLDQPAGVKFVRMTSALTAMTALSSTGALYGWGVTTSYEHIDHYPIERLDVNVEHVQTGQGYVLWRKMDGQWWGQGYNPRGAVGHKASMEDGDYGDRHKIWFAGWEFRSCTNSAMNRTNDSCHRLLDPWDGVTGPAREKQYQFSLQQCEDYVDFVWPTKGPNGETGYPWDGRKGLCT